MRTTLNINDEIYRAVQIHALECDTTISAYLEVALTQQMLEDMADMQLANDRAAESSHPFSSLVQDLKWQ